MDASYLSTQIGNIIGQLHGLFDEIGVPNHERNTRETELFTALSDALHEHLRHVTDEKNELIEDAKRIIKSIQQMKASLNDEGSHDYDFDGDSELKISYPLNQCLQILKEKYNAISNLHRERFEEVKKLADALESYSSHLEPSFVKIALPPTISNGQSPPPTFDLSPSYVAKLDNEFARVYEEYMRRIDVVKVTCDEIIKLWAELGTPQAQTDAAIIQNHRDSPEQLGLHQEDISRLGGRKEKLVEEKKSRERKLKDVRTVIEGLWDRLGIEEQDRKAFLNSNRGCGLRVLNEYDQELSRLNELKRQNLHLFIEDARCKLQELWDSLYFSEEEMLDFTPAFSDVTSDALLSAHEVEIERLEALREQRAPVLHLIDRHESLLQDKRTLAESSQDASRLLARGAKGERRDPTRLLREEKMRKRIHKELPKVEAELLHKLEEWEEEYGRPYLVRGERYLDGIEAAAVRNTPARSKSQTSHRPPTRMNMPVRANTVTTTTTTTTITVPTKTGPGSSCRSDFSKSVPPRCKTPTSRSRSNTAGLKTPTNAFSSSTMRHNNPLTQSISSNSRTPSRIPARIPLGTMRQSPTRRTPLESLQDPISKYATIRRMGPPKLAPPPKMRDLFTMPRPKTSHESIENVRPESVLSSSSGGSVRHIDYESPYDDRPKTSHERSYFSQTMRGATPQPYHDLQSISQQQPYHDTHSSVSSSSRQASSTSNSSGASVTTTATSTSENWETFDDNSEPEQDATDDYYAKVKAAQIKRHAPESVKKQLRNMYAGQSVRTDEPGRILSGSEAGWTDAESTY